MDTPTTLAEFLDIINGISWSADCEDWAQSAADLQERLEAIRLGLELLNPIRLYVVSDDTPTLSDWQTAWEKKGYTLPITGTVWGLWETQSEPRHSMDYVWYKNSMQPLRATWWKGSTQLIPFTVGALTNSTSLSTTESQQVNQAWTLDRDAYITALLGSSRATDTTTTLQWRAGTDSVNTTRGILWPNAVSNAAKIQYQHFVSSAKMTSAGGLQFLYRTISGTGTLRLTNDAQTRKMESGYYPHFIGDNNVVMIRAVYL